MVITRVVHNGLDSVDVNDFSLEMRGARKGSGHSQLDARQLHLMWSGV